MRKIYEYRENTVWCSVYDYTLNTVKEMESAGWETVWYILQIFNIL